MNMSDVKVLLEEKGKVSEDRNAITPAYDDAAALLEATGGTKSTLVAEKSSAPW